MGTLFGLWLPKGPLVGRPVEDRGASPVGDIEIDKVGTRNLMVGKREQSEREKPPARWNAKAWDAYEYRANVPTLAQFDRDRSSRGRVIKHSAKELYQLIRPNIKVVNSRQERKVNDETAGGCKRTRLQENHGGDVGGSKPPKVSEEVKIPLKMAGEKTKDRRWLQHVRTNFTKKFYAASTLASKHTKRKKVVGILDGMNETFPLTVGNITSLAAVLDATGMRAGDRYLSEAKAMHIEEGFEWDLRLDRQASTCKTAMQRDRGPEQRAKEVKVLEIDDKTWKAVNESEKEP